MKAAYYAIAALALLCALTACTPDNESSGGSGEIQNNPDELTVTGDALDITDRSATITGYANLPFELGDAEVGIMYDNKQSFEGARKIAAAGLDGNNKYTVTVTGLASSTTYYYKSYVQNGMAVKYGKVRSFTTKKVEEKIPDAVDLGIVVDGKTIKWASFNLGASSPEEYGDYYAWGETAPKENYSWETYELYNGSESTLTRYNNNSSYGTVDNKTEFKDYNYADDAARARLGGKWRMPTDAEWTELMTKCTWTWTSNYNNTGVAGVLTINGYSTS